jgi:hypothetical protein
VKPTVGGRNTNVLRRKCRPFWAKQFNNPTWYWLHYRLKLIARSYSIIDETFKIYCPKVADKETPDQDWIIQIRQLLAWESRHEMARFSGQTVANWTVPCLSKFDRGIIKRCNIYRIVDFLSFSMEYQGRKKTSQDLVFVLRKMAQFSDWNIFWTCRYIEKQSTTFDRAYPKVQSMNFSKVFFGVVLSYAMKSLEIWAPKIVLRWSYLRNRHQALISLAGGCGAGVWG